MWTVFPSFQKFATLQDGLFVIFPKLPILMWVVEEDGENGPKYNVCGQTYKILIKKNNKEKEVMIMSGKCTKIFK